MTVVLARKLADLGASPEVIAVAVEAVTLASADVRGLSADTRRQRDKLRKRARRKTLKQQRETEAAQANDGAACVRDMSADEPAARSNFLPSLSLNLEGSTEEGSKSSKKARSENARARGTRMQPGAVLSDADRAAAIELGADPDRIKVMWDEFVDYWTGIPGQRGTKLGERGWAGTWRNRVRTLVTKGNGNANGPHRNGTSQTSRPGATGQDAILAGMGRIAARVAERGASERRDREPPADDDAARRRDARLI